VTTIKPPQIGGVPARSSLMPRHGQASDCLSDNVVEILVFSLKFHLRSHRNIVFGAPL
jgi:hypothetical protein